MRKRRTSGLVTLIVMLSFSAQSTGSEPLVTVTGTASSEAA